MDAPFTPGPWRSTEAAPCSYFTIIGPGHDDLADVYSSEVATTSVTPAQAFANARVMAMAPELVATVADLLSGFGTTDLPFLNKARDVLARAMAPVVIPEAEAPDEPDPDALRDRARDYAIEGEV